VRTVLEEAIDAAIAKGLKTGQYISDIGRILGM
jgi:methionine aminopeptidase